MLVPTTAAKLGNVVDQADQLPPLLVLNLYSILQLNPPPLSVTPVKVRVWPAQTVASTGDLVAVGAAGSATTVTVGVPDRLEVQPNASVTETRLYVVVVAGLTEILVPLV